MRRWLGTLIWLGIAIGLIVFIVARREWGEVPEGELLLRLNPKDVLRIELISKERPNNILIERLSLKHPWRMLKPVNVPADQNATNSLVNHFELLTIEAELPESALGDNQYGLKEPQAICIVHTQHNKKFTLRLGGKAADSSYCYAILEGRASPVVITSSLLDDVQKNTDAYRDRNVTKLDSNSVVRLSLLHDNKSVVCMRSGIDEWEILEPIHTIGDLSAIENLLKTLNAINAKRFVDDTPQNLAGYGLETPTLRLEATSQDGAAPLKLIIGTKEESNGNSYAKCSRIPSVFTLQESDVVQLKKTLTDLRSKNVFPVQQDTIERIALNHSTSRIELERVTTPSRQGSQDFWQIIKPIQARADTWKVNELLLALSSVEADKFIDYTPSLEPYGLENPQFEVRVWLKKTKEPKLLQIGTKYSDGTIFVRNAHFPGTAIIKDNLLSKLTIDPNDIRDWRLLSINTDTLDHITLRWDNIDVRLVKKNDGWLLTHPTRKSVPTEALEGLFATLQEESLKPFQSLSSRGKHSFNKPSLIVELKLRDVKTPLTLTFSEPDNANDSVFVQTSTGEQSLEVATELLTSLREHAQQLTQ